MFEREFYRLSELAARWDCSVSDLLHLGLQNRAHICVNIPGRGRLSSLPFLPPGLSHFGKHAEINPPIAEELKERFAGLYHPLTYAMMNGIYKLEYETLRSIETPNGLPLELHRAIRFSDGPSGAEHDPRWRWQEYVFDPPVIIDIDNLVMLNEEVKLLDLELLKPVTAVASQAKASDEFAMRAKADKGLATTERNTLLTIIAGLCNYSAIELNDRGAANQIAKMTEEIGAAVSDDTVRRWLKAIPGALDARMK